MSLLTDGPRVRLRTHAAVRGYVEKVCFKTGPPGLVGTELEWLVASRDDPSAPVPIPHLRLLLEAAGPPPRGSRLTFEPGGQLELSSAAHRGASACWRALAEDAAHVRRALAPAGLVLLPTALDPYRPPRRQLRLPRYEAMAGYFAATGSPTGEAMMNSTAALQVNLDLGADLAEAARRWRLLHTLGPTLVAAFANSPVHAGRSTGWRCGRQRVWQDLDPCRTAAPAEGEPVEVWTDYLLDARVMLQRRDGPDWSAPPGRTFRTWMAGADAPGDDDLALHLTTLFPPVRPRGWLEVRYLDAQPEEWWPVPVAVLSALVDDRAAGDAAAEACADHTDWTAAARDGYAVPGLHAAAQAVFAAALAALRRTGEDPLLVRRVAAFADTYVQPGRCPADDPIPEVP